MPIQRVAVIGSGLMGHGIAQVLATAGREVALVDVSEAALARARQRIKESLDKLAEKGRLKESPDLILGRIKTTTDLPLAASDADFIIEAVFEDIALKQRIMGEADAHAPPHAILATNSSSLSVTAIAGATARKDKVIGMHWMNPPQIMGVVEIIKGKYTSDDTLQSTIALCRDCGKQTFVAQQDVWMFLALRAHSGLLIESSLMYLRKEAAFQEIDATIKYGLGLPMGEFEFIDFTGAVEIMTRAFDSLGSVLKAYPGFEPWPALVEANRVAVEGLWRPMADKNLKGIKTGRGFYDYPGEKYTKPDIRRELAGKVEPIQLLAPVLNVSAWCVTHGVGTIEDTNKAFRLALGWPRGVFDYVDDYGAGNIVSALKDKQKRAPAALQPFYEVDPFLANWKR